MSSVADGLWVRRLVYVDSGSTDGSVKAARTLGAEVVALDMSQPFTAARARNAGLASLAADPPEFVQLLDGDCQLQSDWRRHWPPLLPIQRLLWSVGDDGSDFPKPLSGTGWRTANWNTPVGPARACGGDALMRFADLRAVGGYRDDLIAGEEPELCLRLIRRGGRSDRCRDDAA